MCFYCYGKGEIPKTTQPSNQKLTGNTHQAAWLTPTQNVIPLLRIPYADYIQQALMLDPSKV